MRKIIILLMALAITFTNLQGIKTSPIGIALIKKYEGLRLTAYKCPANVWTIGYGNTKFAAPGKRITKAMAMAYLRYDLNRFEKYIERRIPRALKWHEADALVSFCFNLGYRLNDKLRTAIISQNTNLVVYKLKLYTKARVRGKLTELKGLVRRRIDEANLYAGLFYKLDFLNKNHLTIKEWRDAVWRDGHKLSITNYPTL